jgi:transposase
MGRPKEENAAYNRVLEVLSQKSLSTKEIAEALDVPEGTSRSILSVLRREGLVEPKPELKRGKPFQLTEAGKKRLQELKQVT